MFYLFKLINDTVVYSDGKTFLIYMADAFGYLGSMAVLLYKNFGMSTISWLKFFINGAYWLSIIGSISVVVSFFYLRKKHRKAKFNVVAYEN